MTQEINYSCACGQTTAKVSRPSPKAGNRVRCYCKDCQAFVNWLVAQGGADILDENRGSELYQTLGCRLEITAGKENLAAMRLSPKGMIRWYTTCCHSPFGNTLGPALFTFVGLPVSGFDDASEKTLGPLKASVFAEHAPKGSHPAENFGFRKGLLRILGREIAGKFSARTRKNPFRPDDVPLKTPQILTLSERQAVTPE